MNDTGSLAALRTGHNAGKPFDVERVRADFPILGRRIYGDRPLVFLDSGASAQKPKAVIDCMRQVMEEEYANVHRGAYYLSQRATERYEAVRDTVARFINARGPDEIVFTHGGTEAVNLVAASYGRSRLKAGDEVIISAMEHHANIVPWQMLRDEKGIVLKIVPIDADGNFRLDAYAGMLGPRTRLVAVTHVSNVLGTVVPVKEVARLAHERDVPVLIDGCQGVTHMPVDVQDLDADFYLFSGHKLYGPTGIGVLYGRRELLEAMPPYQSGGDMIDSVSFARTTFKDAPWRFEAGTPPIIETIGLGAAIDYVAGLGMESIAAHEHEVLDYAHQRLDEIPGLTILGRAKEKSSILSFAVEGAHPHDVATILDRAGVAVRAGHHCAEPLFDLLGLPGATRASLGLYNTKAEVDVLAEAVRTVREFFG